MGDFQQVPQAVVYLLSWFISIDFWKVKWRTMWK